jgi:hypothetical protein
MPHSINTDSASVNTLRPIFFRIFMQAFLLCFKRFRGPVKGAPGYPQGLYQTASRPQRSEADPRRSMRPAKGPPEQPPCSVKMEYFVSRENYDTAISINCQSFLL